MRLSERYRARREEIMATDRPPDLLDRISQLANEPSADFGIDDLPQVVDQLVQLRDELSRRCPRIEDLRALDRAIDEAVLTAVRRFTTARDRTLEALRALADNIPQLAWIADASGTVTWSNRRWIELAGDAEIDKPWRAVHPDHVGHVVESFQQAIASGETWEDTFPVPGQDGRDRWYLSRAVPIRDTSGKVVRWFGTHTDVTVQRFLDDVMRVLSSSLDYEETLERVAHLAVPSFADWCVVELVSPDGGLQRVAIAHQDPTKIAAAQEWACKFPADPSGKGGVPSVIRTGEPEYATEIRWATLPDNERTRTLRQLGLESYIIVPMLARDRTIGAISLVSTDPRRRYRTSDVAVARELGQRAGLAVDNARLYQESRDAVRVREDVLAIVSHDLRNPLGAIDLSASMLLQAHSAEPRSRRQLEIIRRSTDRMEHMISDLLDMASIQAGRLSLVLRREPALPLVKEVLDAHESLAGEKHLRLVRECELADLELDCDRDRIAQVFGNLLGNAIKFCRSGDVVTMSCRRHGDHAQFEVADTGPGIAPADLPRIFEPYYSASRTLKQSTGLGLYISKGIVAAHGGTLEVASKPGSGARFVVTLPLAASGDS